MNYAENIQKVRDIVNKMRYLESLEKVRALPVRYREVIHLFYHEGYSTAQIAKILNRRESTVRSHLRRGRDKLRELLKGRDDLETGI